jgi:general secretion pathway protein C
MKRWPLVASFLLFILLCASIAYWALQLFKPPLRPVAAPQQVATAEIRPEAAAALLGGGGERSDSAGNYQLTGVIFSGTPADSVAILSIEGKPAQAIRAGSEILPGVTVKEVHPAYVLLTDDGATRRVELPEKADDQGRPASVSPVPVRPTQQPGTSATPARVQKFPPTAPAANPQTAPPTTGAAPAGQPASPAPSPAPAQGTQAAPSATQTEPTAPPTVVVNPPPSPEPPEGEASQPASGAVPPAR